MRSDRIHHRERLKNARRFHWGKDLRTEPKEAGVVVDTPTKCSCWMCGNPGGTPASEPFRSSAPTAFSAGWAATIEPALEFEGPGVCKMQRAGLFFGCRILSPAHLRLSPFSDPVPGERMEEVSAE